MNTYTEENLFKTEDQASDHEAKSDGGSAEQDQGLVGYQEAIDSEDEEGVEKEDIEEKEESEEEDGQFDHLVPKNWEELADMRLRMLEKEYNQCLNYEMKQPNNFQYQGLSNILKT